MNEIEIFSNFTSPRKNENETFVFRSTIKSWQLTVEGAVF